jgi:hypothetical protein
VTTIPAGVRGLRDNWLVRWRLVSGAAVLLGLTLAGCAPVAQSRVAAAPVSPSQDTSSPDTPIQPQDNADAPEADVSAQYAAAVVREAKPAGINPQLLMAIVYNESYKPHDAASQRLWQALNPGASFGIVNMHQAAFDQARRGRPFAGRSFQELPDDPELALQAAAWYLHDLSRSLPAHPATTLTHDQLLALGYNTGPGNMRLFARGVTPGPMAETYLSELKSNWDKAAAALTKSGDPTPGTPRAQPTPPLA